MPSWFVAPIGERSRRYYKGRYRNRADSGFRLPRRELGWPTSAPDWPPGDKPRFLGIHQPNLAENVVQGWGQLGTGLDRARGRIITEWPAIAWPAIAWPTRVWAHRGPPWQASAPLWRLAWSWPAATPDGRNRPPLLRASTQSPRISLRRRLRA